MKKQVNQKVWTGALLIIGLVAIWFFWPQIGTIVLAALMAYLFYPFYTKLKGKKGRGGLAAFTTLMVSFLVVIIPVAFVAVSAFGQLAAFANQASNSQYWQNMPEFVDRAIDVTNDMLGSITGQSPSITEDGVVNFLRNTVPAVARGSAQFLLGVATSLPGLGIAFIVYIYMFIAFLKYGPRILAKVRTMSPFDEKTTEYYLERIGLMTNAMVKGQLILSMITAAFSAILLIFLGYGHLFFILFVLFTILNFIPLGSGIVLVPMAVFAMFNGQLWAALLVIVLFYVFGNLEPLWRSKLIPKKIQLPVALMMLGTFCGIAYFGILGIVYGPVIMILIITTVNLYIEAKRQSTTATATAGTTS